VSLNGPIRCQRRWDKGRTVSAGGGAVLLDQGDRRAEAVEGEVGGGWDYWSPQ